MPELLLELFSEEIPARMQARAADDLRGLVASGLNEAGLVFERFEAHAGPRRLSLSVHGLAAHTPDVTEERKGPRVDAPEAAVQGFLRSAGVTLEQCVVQEDKRGKFYIAKISRPGRATSEVIAELVPDVIARFPWPKSMRWGKGAMRWVRPLHAILCVFDGEVVEFQVENVRSGDFVFGHRFMAPGKISARNFREYEEKLREAKVIVSTAERSDVIRSEANRIAAEQGLTPIEDEGLIAETAGLAEWPVVLAGSFDKGFLDLPAEVIATSLKNHQKCFALREGRPFETRPAGAPQGEGGGVVPHPEVRAERASKDGGVKLANRYLLVSNLVAKDGGKRIVEGNNRVIAARLSDARFFWDQDRKTKLENLVPKLDQITFHAKLGSQGERVRRIEGLAGEIAKIIGADVEKAKLAARLCKADLVTGMVGEFPELQGLMGGYYARAEGLDEDVAEAIRDHYKPQGPSDMVPEGKVAQAVGLADKLDTLVGFWAIDEKPTGSKDPYALRRSALGIIRIILESELRLAMEDVIFHALDGFDRLVAAQAPDIPVPGSGTDVTQRMLLCFSIANGLCRFLAERLKVLLRENGARHDLIEAVVNFGVEGEILVSFSGSPSDFLMIVRRVEALGRFLETDDGVNLLIGVKRANNILKIEEKKDGRSYEGMPDKNLLKQGEEKALASAIDRAEALAKKAVEAEDFEAAMAAIAKLRAPVDTFFDKVTVNVPDQTFRENRLKLLSRIRSATLAVADFSRIEG